MIGPKFVHNRSSYLRYYKLCLYIYIAVKLGKSLADYLS